MRRQFEERFWSKVDKSGECWVWTAALNKSGYGACGSPGGKTVRAHRAAWELINGEIPSGLWVLHRCDNRLCVNPAHLFLGTHIDNMKDMAQKGRHFSKTRPECLARGDRHRSRTSPETLPRGERCGSAKLNDDAVRLIRRDFEAGMTVTELGKRHSVTYQTITYVVEHVTWKHI